MGNAFWLFTVVPAWYCVTIASPFGAGLLSAIPAFGILSLAIGIVGGVAKREMRLTMFVLPIAASEILVAAAGFLRGTFRYDPNYLVTWIVGAFVLFQIAGAAYVVWRLDGARWSAGALAIFTSSYALFAGFVAVMAFTDDWV